MRRLLIVLASVLALLTGLSGLGLGALAWFNLRDESPLGETAAAQPPDPVRVERGAYLARAGNCAACHTERGGRPYAGGRPIVTPFGTVYATNLTPDAQTGLGGWSVDHFWRALHNGRSRDGRLLYPAFPYPHYTRVTRADADALYDYLRTLAPVARTNTPHALQWPYRTQLALAVWRALYFEPGNAPVDPAHSAEWNRGEYLVNGLAHCPACHGARDLLGGADSAHDVSGGMIPMQNWYAPSLALPEEAAVTQWTTREIVQFLRAGMSPRGSALGPMADVVQYGTQYLGDADLSAMAVYLRSLGPAAGGAATVASSAAGTPATAAPRVAAAPAPAGRGARLYERHCSDCHGQQGEGVAGAYPGLAGNRAVTMAVTANLVQIVLGGGFAPATAANPRPFGMPPFATVLSDAEVADVLTHMRTSWGHRASTVSEFDVSRQRSSLAP